MEPGMSDPENLRQWQKALQVEEKKPPRYRSKHDPKVPPTYSTFTKTKPSTVAPEDMPPKKPKVPKFNANNKPSCGVQTKKNFVVSNAVEAIVHPAKKILEEERRYTEKHDYGKKPAYLCNVQNQIQEEKDILQEYLEVERAENEIVTEPLPEEDRLELIKKLKRKWGYLNREFQKIIDTSSANKRRLKENLEAQLFALEKDIKVLSRGAVKILEA